METIQQSASSPAKTSAEREKLEAVAGKIAVCTNCILSKQRIHVVPGEGVLNPTVMVIGEGPGENEDLQGKPFVGRSGKLLDVFLDEIGLNREKIYIANIVKCRPPENRDPTSDEQDCCINWLRNQVYIIRPKIIVALGRIAAMKIINPDIPNINFIVVSFIIDFLIKNS